MEMKRRIKASGLNMTKIAKANGVKRGDRLAAAIMLGAAAVAADQLGTGGIQTDLEDFTG